MEAIADGVSARTRSRRTRDDARDDRETPARGAPADAVLRLQRTAGNRAVAGLLAREDKQQKDKPKAPADDFRAAVKGKSWHAAAAALDAVPDGEMQGLLKPLAAAELKRLDGAAAKLKDLTWARRSRIQRHIVFIQRPGPAVAAAHQDDVKVTKPGKAEGPDKVGGGEVTVRTGMSIEVEPEGDDDTGAREEAVSMSYTGPHAGRTRWLQFISREVVVRSADGKDKWVGARVESDGGATPYALTTDPDKRVWNTDAAKDAPSPFYEDSGVNNRTADATTIFDTPGPVADIVRKQFEAPAKPKKVISRAHLVTYLVRDMDVLEKVTIDLEWVFIAPKNIPPTPTVTRAKATELDGAHRERLQKQFPKFAYLP